MYKKHLRSMCVLILLALLLSILLIGCQSSQIPSQLKIGIVGEHSPWEELDAEGHQAGISIDLIDAFKTKYNTEVELVWLESDQYLSALDNQTVDCIISSVPASEKLFSRYSISDPYTKTFSIMLYHKNNTALSKSMLNNEAINISVLENSYEETLARSQFSNASIRLYDSRKKAVESVVTKTSDVFLDDALSVLYLYTLNSSALTLNPAPLSDQYQYYVVISQKDNYELSKLWNALFTELRENGFYDALYKKYVSPMNAYMDQFNLQIDL